MVGVRPVLFVDEDVSVPLACVPLMVLSRFHFSHVLPTCVDSVDPRGSHLVFLVLPCVVLSLHVVFTCYLLSIVSVCAGYHLFAR